MVLVHFNKSAICFVWCVSAEIQYSKDLNANVVLAGILKHCFKYTIQ